MNWMSSGSGLQSSEAERGDNDPLLFIKDHGAKDVFNNPRYVAKFLYEVTKIIIDKNMLAVWRDVTALRLAERDRAEHPQRYMAKGDALHMRGPRLIRAFDENAKIEPWMFESAEIPSDQKAPHMRPLLAYISQNMVQDLFEAKRGRDDEQMILQRIAAAKWESAAGGAGRSYIGSVLEKIHQPRSANGFMGQSLYALTGYQAVQAFSKTCEIMLAHAGDFKLSEDDRRDLQDGVDLGAYYKAGPAHDLPAEAVADCAYLEQGLKDGQMRFDKKGRISTVKIIIPDNDKFLQLQAE